MKNINIKNNAKLAEFVRFGITGILSTAITYGLYYLLILWLNPSVSFSLGYFVAFVVNYIMTVNFTFKVKASKKNAIGFVISNIINYGFSIAILNGFLWLGMTERMAPIPTMLLAAVCNFFIVRFVMKRY